MVACAGCAPIPSELGVTESRSADEKFRLHFKLRPSTGTRSTNGRCEFHHLIPSAYRPIHKRNEGGLARMALVWFSGLTREELGWQELRKACTSSLQAL